MKTWLVTALIIVVALGISLSLGAQETGTFIPEFSGRLGIIVPVDKALLSGVQISTIVQELRDMVSGPNRDRYGEFFGAIESPVQYDEFSGTIVISVDDPTKLPSDFGEQLLKVLSVNGWPVKCRIIYALSPPTPVLGRALCGAIVWQALADVGIYPFSVGFTPFAPWVECTPSVECTPFGRILITGIDPTKLSSVFWAQLQRELTANVSISRTMDTWASAPNVEVKVAIEAVKKGEKETITKVVPVTEENGKYYELKEDGSKGDEVAAAQVESYNFDKASAKYNQLENEIRQYNMQTDPYEADEHLAKAVNLTKLLQGLTQAFRATLRVAPVRAARMLAEWEQTPEMELALATISGGEQVPVFERDGHYYLINEDGTLGDAVPAAAVKTYKLNDVTALKEQIESLQQQYTTSRSNKLEQRIAGSASLLLRLDKAFWLTKKAEANIARRAHEANVARQAQRAFYLRLIAIGLGVLVIVGVLLLR